MVNPIILAELAKTRHQELLKEAECWRLVSQQMEKNSANLGKFRRMLANVKRRIQLPQHRDLNYPRFSEKNV
jgi:hypothetical protein